MNFWQLNWLVSKAIALRAVLRVFCWATAFLLLMIISALSPKTALALLKTVEPLSGLVKDLFWIFVPENVEFVRVIGRGLSWLGRKAASLTSARTQVAIQLGVLNGLLLVGIIGYVMHKALMFFVQRLLVLRFLKKYDIVERKKMASPLPPDDHV